MVEVAGGQPLLLPHLRLALPVGGDADALGVRGTIDLPDLLEALGSEAPPEGVVGDRGVPDDGAGVGQRRLLALAELLGVLEVQQLGVLRLGDAS